MLHNDGDGEVLQKGNRGKSNKIFPKINQISTLGWPKAPQNRKRDGLFSHLLLHSLHPLPYSDPERISHSADLLLLDFVGRRNSRFHAREPNVEQIELLAPDRGAVSFIRSDPQR